MNNKQYGNNNKYSDNRNNNGSRNYRYNNNRVNYYEQEKVQPKKEFNIMDHPELAYNQINRIESSGPNYVEMCKKKKEEDEEKKPLVDVHDPKYWDRHRYIGPKLLKSHKQSFQVQTYLREASKYAQTIVIPHKTTIYGRDGINWYSSWKETFTEEQWNNMNHQIEQDTLMRIVDNLSERYEKDLQNAFQLNEESGEVNGCLQCHLDSIEYDKYLEKMENQFEDIPESDGSDDGHESEYNSD
jgi:hypothetical protein